jgi:uncharacterized membrane protein YoaK (UPF0700 family)
MQEFSAKLVGLAWAELPAHASNSAIGRTTGMNRHAGSANEWLSFGLALVGGYGDAAGFVIAKTFTGHVTGSLVLATIGVAAHDCRATLGHLSAVVFFLAGIPLSILMERVLAAWSSWRLLPTIMGIEVMLIAAAYFALASHAVRGTELFVICMSLALGLQNGAFRRTGGISVHTTYLTGTITSLIGAQMDRYGSLAIPITAATPGTPDAKVRISCGVWIAFVLGGSAGAVMVLRFGEAGVLGAAVLLVAVILGNSIADRR